MSGGALQFFAGVYDGHGGSAVAEWCKNNLLGVVQETWKSMGSAPQAAITEAYLAADKVGNWCMMGRWWPALVCRRRHHVATPDAARGRQP